MRFEHLVAAMTLAILAGCGGQSPSEINSSDGLTNSGSSGNSGTNNSGVDTVILPPVRGDCAPGAEPLTARAVVADSAAKTYFILPFTVDSSSQRIEIGYGWMDQSAAPNPNPLDSTTFDLGLWDQNGYRNARGFRGWSGNRVGRIDQGQNPAFIEAGLASRGYLPGPVQGGTWYLEIGAGAVKTGGSEWYAEINCLGSSSTADFQRDGVDPDFIATQNNPPFPGWTHADFHMHGFHSHAEGSSITKLIENSRSVGLDVLFYTEYVVPQHWYEIGQAQRDNPDVLIYPGREIISYFGHINTLGETPNVIEYRHGFENVLLGDIQRDSLADGALIQVNHPTTFEGPLFEDLCRGCALIVDDQLDFNNVASIEVQGGPTETTSASLGVSGPPGAIENPFSGTAIDYWEEKLLAGFKITATSGSDARGNETLVPGRSGHGSSSTALCGREDGLISRASVRAAIESGCAFVKTFGTLHSPHVEMQVTGPSNQSATYGGSIAVATTETATMTLDISGATNQLLYLIQNGNEIAAPVLCDGVPMTSPALLASDNVRCEATISRAPSGDGPLGTFWRFDIKKREPATTVAPVEIRTVVANPVFLTD